MNEKTICQLAYEILTSIKVRPDITGVNVNRKCINRLSGFGIDLCLQAGQYLADDIGQRIV
jgi:hypothetical protein